MPATDLPLLIEAVRAGGGIALGHFRKAPETWDKADGQGPVTAADLEVDAALRLRLTGARPGYGWLSEETPDDPAARAGDRVFIVDPIDGTRAFIAGTTAFATVAAVAERGRVTAAAVFLPAQDKLYAAARGAGATLDGRPLSVRRPPRSGGAALAVRSTLDRHHWPGGAPRLKPSFRPSLAYRFCLLAEGRFDAVLTFRPAWEWDVAAGSLIATEAGARVTDASGVEPVFNAPKPVLDGVIAAAPELHADLVARRLGR